ncbi:MAG: LCP family protein [Clostridia bacterium]|jgi:polyisoprenyl-teichoic acid--peptidoglycan teichoic acid transferase|nr:LCP family protein [Clostridia bacterium]MBT7122987.1 LCP family protein [Clostridia bacterium]
MEEQNEKRYVANNKKKRKSRLFGAPVTALKVLIWALLILLIIGVVFVVRFVFRTAINPTAAFDNTPAAAVSQPIASQQQTADTSGAPQTITPQPTITLSPRELLEQSADYDFMADRVNVLITGIDYSIEREAWATYRTDTILLLSINFKTGEADMLSIPRDSYADIAFTDAKWKINGAFMSAGGADGSGFAGMMKTVSDCIGGIPVDYYIAVEMQAVKDIVDIIGGVWYDVDYEIDMNGRHLDTGYQHLDGQAVLDYMRARKGITSSSDIYRIDRQQRLLMEVFNQMKSESKIAQIPQIYNTLNSQIMTNLNFEQIVALSLFALDLDLTTDLDRYTLKGEYMPAYNASKYYVLDHEYTEFVVREIFNVTPSINWEYSLEFVKNDMARINLEKAILDTKQLLISNAELLGYVYTLTPPGQGQDPIEYFEFFALLEDYTFIEERIAMAEFVLINQDTDEMNEQLALMTLLIETIEDLIEIPPTPPPTPSPSPSPTPSPSPSPSPSST